MTRITISNLPALEVDANLYRGDDELFRVTISENGGPLTPAMRAALADARVVWKSDFKQRVDSTLLFSAALIRFDPLTDTVLIDLTSADAAKLTPACVADLQVSWPDGTGRIRRRTLATFSISTTPDISRG